VPQPHRLVGAGGGQARAVAAVRDAEDYAGVAVEGGEVLTRPAVPQPHRLVGAGGGQALAVGAERHLPDPPPTAPDGAQPTAAPPGRPTAAPSCPRWGRRGAGRRG